VLHVAKNPGDSRAIPFAIIRPAAIATNAAGSHHDLTSNGAFPYGPYHIGPKAPTGTDVDPTDGGGDPNAPTGGVVGTGTGATGAGAGTVW
jgi:hypothetical protein